MLQSPDTVFILLASHFTGHDLFTL